MKIRYNYHSFCPLLAFLPAVSRNVLRISLNAWVRGRLAGQDICTASAFHTFHTVDLFKGLTVMVHSCLHHHNRYDMAWADTYAASAADTCSWFKSCYLVFCEAGQGGRSLAYSTSTVNSACPIIGPPEMIFSGSVLKPPAASISS